MARQLCKDNLKFSVAPRYTFGAMVQYESRLREYRKKAGLSQEALARELKVSRQTIVNIERGISEPRVMLAIGLALVLGAAVADLFGKELRKL